jgi:hypothetical protein
LVFVHYKWYGAIVVIVLLVANVIVAGTIFKHNFFVKTLWTAVASLLAPTCFVSDHAMVKYHDPKSKVNHFYVSNIITFVIIISWCTTTFNILSAVEVIECTKLDLFLITFGIAPQGKIMAVGSILWICLSLGASLLNLFCHRPIGSILKG